MKSVFLALVTFFFVFPLIGADQFAAKLAELPFEKVKTFAHNGNGMSQQYLGWMYFHGVNVPQSEKDACVWWRKAAEQGLPESQRLLAYMHIKGSGVEQSYKEALKWLNKAVAQKDVKSIYLLAEMYDKGEGVAENDVEAFKLYQKAAIQGLPDAIYQTATSHLLGIGTKKDPKKSFELYYSAALLGHVDSQYSVAASYSIGGNIVPRNVIASYAWLNLAAANGHKKAEVFKAKESQLMSRKQINEAQQMSRLIANDIGKANVPIPNLKEVLPAKLRREKKKGRPKPGAVAPPAGKIYVATGKGHWVKKKMDNNGKMLMLEDGSIWEIALLDRINTTLWLPVTSITVLDSNDGPIGYNYLLVNTDDGEKVHAKYLGK